MDEHTVRVRPPVWLPIIVAVIAVGGYIAGKSIETRHLDMVTINVNGEGKVYANPDIAQMNFGVQTGRQKTAEDAMKMLSDKMNAVVAAVQKAGIEEKDIVTQQLNLHPSYDWNDGKRVDEGFEANQQLRVKVRDLTKIGDVLTAVTAAGANQAGGVSFTIDDQDAIRAQARQKAIEQAQAKAATLAKELGMQLGRLRGFNEDGSYIPIANYARNEMMMDSMGAGGAVDYAPTPVPSGEQEIRVNVSVMYELR